jgi:hypothetical protein
MEEMRKACKVLIRKHRRIWEYNIRMNFRGIGWEFVNWIHLAQGRDLWLALVNVVMNFLIPQKTDSILIS